MDHIGTPICLFVSCSHRDAPVDKGVYQKGARKGNQHICTAELVMGLHRFDNSGDILHTYQLGLDLTSTLVNSANGDFKFE